jgi:hypothetical protein
MPVRPGLRFTLSTRPPDAAPAAAAAALAPMSFWCARGIGARAADAVIRASTVAVLASTANTAITTLDGQMQGLGDGSFIGTDQRLFGTNLGDDTVAACACEKPAGVVHARVV